MRWYWGVSLIFFGLVACTPEPSKIENESTGPALSSINLSASQTERDVVTTQKGNVQVQLTAPSSGNSEIGTRQLGQADMYMFAARAYQSMFPEMSLEEANRRMRLSSDHATISKVYECAKKQNSFGGMVQVHQPEFEIQLFFTENEAANLAGCTTEAHFVAYSTPISLKEMQETSDKLKHHLAGYGSKVHISSLPAGHSANHVNTSAPTKDPYVIISVKAEVDAETTALIYKIETEISQLKVLYPYIYVQEWEDMDEIIVGYD